MGLFSKKPPASIEGAAAKVPLTTQRSRHLATGWGVGIERLAPAEFIPAGIDIWGREAAMSIPTISRARDLIVGTVGGLPLTQWNVNFGAPEPIETRLPPERWLLRPDRGHTRQYTLAWTVDDLMFHGVAYWHITERLATGFPGAMTWLPYTEVSIDSLTGVVSWGDKRIDPTDVIEFLSPLDGLLYSGNRAITTALNLDAAAERFSLAEIPAGWLEQTADSEPLEASELAEIAATFQAARNQRTVAALNPFLRWKESSMDPSKLQLVEARRYQALELARLANVPSFLVSAETGSGMTYQNSVQARSDLLDFGCMPMLQCIEQTLSGDNVLPRNQLVRFDLNAWLRNPLLPNQEPSPNDAQIALTPDTPVSETEPQPPAANVADGRPRQADGQNATTGDAP